MSRTTEALTPAEGVAISDATTRLVAACLGANPRAREETTPYRAAATGQAIRDHIERNLASPSLAPNSLARQFRLSRAQLYRLFAGEGGIAAYIQARRLARCLRVLTDPAEGRRGIGEIALGLGFGSEAHFSRAFRRAFGISPSEARAQGRIAAPARAGSFISDWIRELDRLAGAAARG